MNCQNLKKRFKLNLHSFSRYKNELRWNIRVEVFDKHHPVHSPSEAIANFDFDYEGDIEDFKSKVKAKLNEICDEATDNALVDCKKIIDDYKGK